MRWTMLCSFDSCTAGQRAPSGRAALVAGYVWAVLGCGVLASTVLGCGSSDDGGSTLAPSDGAGASGDGSGGAPSPGGVIEQLLPGETGSGPTGPVGLVDDEEVEDTACVDQFSSLTEIPPVLQFVVDTSGSMLEEMPRALGAIADFCEAAAVDQVRLLQCDVSVTSDEILSPTELAQCQVAGFGGSNLTPAMELLAADPQVRAAAIITDGDIEFPAEPMSYAVLWVLPPARSAGFAPGYGRIVVMDGEP